MVNAPDATGSGQGKVPRGARRVLPNRKPMQPSLPPAVQALYFVYPVAEPKVPRFATASPTMEHLPARSHPTFPSTGPGAWVPDGSSRFVGVRRGPSSGSDGKREWFALVERMGTQRWLGPFKSETSAAHAVDTALLLLQGPRAQTNFQYDRETFFGGAEEAKAEDGLARVHAGSFADAYRVTRKLPEGWLTAEADRRRLLEVADEQQWRAEEAIAANEERARLKQAAQQEVEAAHGLGGAGRGRGRGCGKPPSKSALAAATKGRAARTAVDMALGPPPPEPTQAPPSEMAAKASAGASVLTPRQAKEAGAAPAPRAPVWATRASRQVWSKRREDASTLHGQRAERDSKREAQERQEREEQMRRDLEEREQRIKEAAERDERERKESEEALAAVATRARDNWPYTGVARCGQWGTRMWRASLQLPKRLVQAGGPGSQSSGQSDEPAPIPVGEFFTARAAAVAHDLALLKAYGQQQPPEDALNYGDQGALRAAASGWTDVAGADMKDEKLGAWAEDAGVPLLVALGADTLTREQLKSLREKYRHASGKQANGASAAAAPQDQAAEAEKDAPSTAAQPPPAPPTSEFERSGEGAEEALKAARESAGSGDGS